MAMLLAALAATIAATLLWQQQRWVGEYERTARPGAGASAGDGGRAMGAPDPVRYHARPSAITALGQPWAYRLPPTPIENGSIGGYIVDAQCRINLNNLSQAGDAPRATRAALQRLFAQLGAPATLLSAMTDWVDADDQVTPGGGAEDAYYLAQSPPASPPTRRSGEPQSCSPFAARMRSRSNGCATSSRRSTRPRRSTSTRPRPRC